MCVHVHVCPRPSQKELSKLEDEANLPIEEVIRRMQAEAAAEAKADTEKKIEDEFEFDPSDLEGLDG